jgi:Cys-rich repeat protein
MSTHVRMLPRVCAALAILSGLLLSIGSVHCGGTSVTPSSDGGGADGSVPPGPPPGNLPPPTSHRPTDDVCPSTRPAGHNSDAGAPDAGFPGQCSRDSDCTQGTNGRCSPPQHNAPAYSCTYDLCSADADCGDGKLCECGTSLGTNGSDGTPMRSGNRCLPGNCRTDSDCGAGGFCSPTYDTTCGQYSGIVGYYCHTAKDECTNDDQCSADGSPAGYCAWDPASGHWACEHGVCAG